MVTKFMQYGDIINSDTKTGVEIDNIPPGTYKVDVSQAFGWHLVKSNLGNLPTKMYGEIFSRADMIINTFKSRASRGVNTGAMFSGDKGSGKTLLAKLVSHRLEKEGIPTIIVDSSFGSSTTDMCNFLSKINQPVVILFDEFDKRFSGRDSQEAMLTLVDGLGFANKLFLFTRNSGYLSEFFVNRPSRVWYSFSYDKITIESMIGYLEDNLKNPAHITKFKSLHDVSSLLSFDIIQSITEELNRYPELSFDTCLNNMGIEMNDIEYKIESFFHEGKEIPVRHNTTVSISDFLSDEDTINVYLDTSSVEKSFSEKLGRKFEQGYGLSNKDFDSVEFDNSRVICKDNKRGIIIVLARPMSNKFISSYLV